MKTQELVPIRELSDAFIATLPRFRVRFFNFDENSAEAELVLPGELKTLYWDMRKRISSNLIEDAFEKKLSFDEIKKLTLTSVELPIRIVTNPSTKHDMGKTMRVEIIFPRKSSVLSWLNNGGIAFIDANIERYRSVITSGYINKTYRGN